MAGGNSVLGPGGASAGGWITSWLLGTLIRQLSKIFGALSTKYCSLRTHIPRLTTARTADCLKIPPEDSLF